MALFKHLPQDPENMNTQKIWTISILNMMLSYTRILTGGSCNISCFSDGESGDRAGLSAEVTGVGVGRFSWGGLVTTEGTEVVCTFTGGWLVAWLGKTVAAVKPGIMMLPWNKTKRSTFPNQCLTNSWWGTETHAEKATLSQLCLLEKESICKLKRILSCWE